MFEGMIRAMVGLSVPDLLHRKVVTDTLVGGVQLHAGTSVVISLSSAAEERPYPRLLFGEPRAAAGQAIHACPGQQMAFGVMLGMIVGVLVQNNLRRKSKIMLSFG
jgi:hypothetical protein